MGSGFGCAPQVRLEVCRQAVRLVWRGEDGIANSEVEGKFAINLPGITNVDLVVAPVHIVEDVCRDFAQPLYVLPVMKALAMGTPVTTPVPLVKLTLASTGFALRRSELPPPLYSNFLLKPRNTPTLIVCEPCSQERSSRPLYRFSPLSQGAIICGVPPLFPRLMVGTPTLCDFKSAGNRVGKSDVRVAVKPGSVPPGVMLMRLLEYANAASLMR